ncbi:MAG: hypothetical protein QOE70_1635 [Chthoniobacter sp.]|jgi:hypothetical protein|nr:hypothetical protein [Chthoniobacter sp.]
MTIAATPNQAPQRTAPVCHACCSAQSPSHSSHANPPLALNSEAYGITTRIMRFLLAVFAALFPIVAHSIGEAGDTDWPKGATVEVQLKLSAVVDTNGHLKVPGDLVIKNPGDSALTIQNPHNRLVLAFVVFDPLGNLVAPKGLAKVDPAFSTRSLPARSTYTHHFETLDFITGSGLFGYELSPGKSYKIMSVYRPAGPDGPGFSTQEVSFEIRQ